MLIKPNETRLKGRVIRVDRAADGFGCNVVFEVTEVGEVTDATASTASRDFVGATPGATLQLFAAEPESVQAGGIYHVTASMVGDARGQRLVLRSARKVSTR